MEKVLIRLRKAFLKPRMTKPIFGFFQEKLRRSLKLGKDFFDDPFDFGIYPSAGEIAIRILAEKTAILGRLKKKIAARLEGGEVIVLKASRGVALERILPALMTRATPPR